MGTLLLLLCSWRHVARGLSHATRYVSYLHPFPRMLHSKRCTTAAAAVAAGKERGGNRVRSYTIPRVESGMPTTRSYYDILPFIVTRKKKKKLSPDVSTRNYVELLAVRETRTLVAPRGGDLSYTW